MKETSEVSEDTSANQVNIISNDKIFPLPVSNSYESLNKQGNTLARCKSCSMLIDTGAYRCPHCGTIKPT